MQHFLRLKQILEAIPSFTSQMLTQYLESLLSKAANSAAVEMRSAHELAVCHFLTRFVLTQHQSGLQANDQYNYGLNVIKALLATFIAHEENSDCPLENIFDIYREAEALNFRKLLIVFIFDIDVITTNEFLAAIEKLNVPKIYAFFSIHRVINLAIEKKVEVAATCFRDYFPESDRRKCELEILEYIYLEFIEKKVIPPAITLFHTLIQKINKDLHMELKSAQRHELQQIIQRFLEFAKRAITTAVLSDITQFIDLKIRHYSPGLLQDNANEPFCLALTAACEQWQERLDATDYKIDFPKRARAALFLTYANLLFGYQLRADEALDNSFKEYLRFAIFSNPSVEYTIKPELDFLPELTQAVTLSDKTAERTQCLHRYAALRRAIMAKRFMYTTEESPRDFAGDRSQLPTLKLLHFLAETTNKKAFDTRRLLEQLRSEHQINASNVNLLDLWYLRAYYQAWFWFDRKDILAARRYFKEIIERAKAHPAVLVALLNEEEFAELLDVPMLQYLTEQVKATTSAAPEQILIWSEMLVSLVRCLDKLRTHTSSESAKTSVQFELALYADAFEELSEYLGHLSQDHLTMTTMARVCFIFQLTSINQVLCQSPITKIAESIGLQHIMQTNQIIKRWFPLKILQNLIEFGLRPEFHIQGQQFNKRCDIALLALVAYCEKYFYVESNIDINKLISHLGYVIHHYIACNSVVPWSNANIVKYLSEIIYSHCAVVLSELMKLRFTLVKIDAVLQPICNRYLILSMNENMETHIDGIRIDDHHDLRFENDQLSLVMLPSTPQPAQYKFDPNKATDSNEAWDKNALHDFMEVKASNDEAPRACQETTMSAVIIEGLRRLAVFTEPTPAQAKGSASSTTLMNPFDQL